MWHHLQWGGRDRKTPSQLRSQTQTSLLNLAGDHPENIHTIVLSFEAIFGTLSSGLVEPYRKKAPNKEHKMGLYRHARSRTKRLMRGLEESLDHNTIQWTILFASRTHEVFIRSCHTQLLKEGQHTPETSHFDTFRKTANFSYSNPQKLTETLKKVSKKREVNIVNIKIYSSLDWMEVGRLLLSTFWQ